MKNAQLLAFFTLSFAMLAGCTGGESSTDRSGSKETALGGENGPEADQSEPSNPPGTPEKSPDQEPAPSCTPIDGTIGNGGANPAALYCTALGYTSSNSTCALPDGSTCPDWDFYRGACGGAHSFCALHGGTVSSKTEDMGGWTAVYAVCTFNGGRSCKETDFATTCQCE